MQKRRIKAKDIIDDIRAGMKCSDLMTKYRLKPTGLRTALQQLVEVSAMTKEELNSLESLHDVSVTGMRQFPRSPVKLPTHIFDGGSPDKAGHITDTSEKGICVQGIEAEVGQVKTFIIRRGPLGSRSTVVFEGTCRWTRKGVPSPQKDQAGFEITDISAYDSGVFARFIAS